MSLKLNLIVAASENMGIGLNNDLPWRLKREAAYFNRITSVTKDTKKKNVVVMGRRTWDSTPPKFRPLSNRINFILSRSKLNVEEYNNTYSFNTWDEIFTKLNDSKFKEKYEGIWVIGGSAIYKYAMDSKYFYRLYFTEIKRFYESDTFFPPLVENLRETRDPEVPNDMQEEHGVQYIIKVYENTLYKE